MKVRILIFFFFFKNKSLTKHRTSAKIITMIRLLTSKTAIGFKSHIYAWSHSYIVISQGKKKSQQIFFALLYVNLNLNNKHCSKNLIGLCRECLIYSWGYENGLTVNRGPNSNSMGIHIHVQNVRLGDKSIISFFLLHFSN